MKKNALIIILMILVASVGFAQPGNPDGGDPDVPITGIEILIGLGSLFGVSRFFKGKNKSNKEL